VCKGPFESTEARISVGKAKSGQATLLP